MRAALDLDYTRITDAGLIAGLQLTQAFKQSGKTKRLLQEQGTRRQFHIRQAFGVARHEEHLNFWLKLDDLAMEIGATESRRHNVADKDVDPPGVFLGQI